MPNNLEKIEESKICECEDKLQFNGYNINSCPTCRKPIHLPSKDRGIGGYSRILGTKEIKE